MTIEKAIAKQKRIVYVYEKLADCSKEDMKKTYENLAKDSQQMADWLTELIKLRKCNKKCKYKG